MTASINKILALPVNKGYSSWGADMGRRNWVEGDPEKLHLQKVQFQDACYDVGGAYWGGPANLYCAFSPDDTANENQIRVFVRAGNRTEAKERVLEALPGQGWTFFR